MTTPREEAEGALSRIKHLDERGPELRTRYATAQAILDLADAVRSTRRPASEPVVHSAWRTCPFIEVGQQVTQGESLVTCPACLALRADDPTFQPGAVKVGGVPAEELTEYRRTVATITRRIEEELALTHQHLADVAPEYLIRKTISLMLHPPIDG